jgi:hypothetical protein
MHPSPPSRLPRAESQPRLGISSIHPPSAFRAGHRLLQRMPCLVCVLERGGAVGIRVCGAVTGLDRFSRPGK